MEITPEQHPPDPQASQVQVEAAMAEAPAAPVSASIAPAWHTVLLAAGILALSVGGSTRLTAQHHTANRYVTYASTAVMELLMLGWVALGVRLRKVPFRSLFGVIAGGLRGFALDLGVACLFWMGSMMILGTLGLAWTTAEYAATHKHLPTGPGEKIEPSASQKQTLRTLEQLAPADGKEIATWVLLCLMVGLIEEAVFRGYLQQQFTAWSKGNAAVGVAFSALLFGAAHGYQGLRNMVLLAILGALFSLLAIFRRGLRAGIFAHSWHDLFTGLLLAVFRARHLI